MNRLTNYCGKWIHHCGWYPDTKLRLYNSAKGCWGGVNPHDKFEMNPDSTVGFLKGDLLHYSYYTVEEHIRQADKFSTIAAKELVSLGKTVSYFLIIVNPVAKFIRNYILRLGFLDGFYGFIICRIAAHETFQKYTKARQLKHSKK